MKWKKVLLFCLLFLCITANASAATNWVYLNDTRSYIDTETAFRSGENLFFWELIIYEEDNLVYLAGEKTTIKYEVKLTHPRTLRELESHDYDKNNQEFFFITTPGAWFTAYPGDYYDKLINFALRYAK